MLEDFLKTKTSKESLKIALDVIKEYKSNESLEEWSGYFFSTWMHLEKLEEYLEELTRKFKPINYYDAIIKAINTFIKIMIKDYNKINSENQNSIYDYIGGLISYAYYIRHDITLEQKNFLVNKSRDFYKYRIEEL